MEVIATDLPSWSFSTLKGFDTCPRQLYETKILKNYPQEKSHAADYGDALHKAAEYYIGKGEPLPKEFQFLQGLLDRLLKLPGEKYPEMKMALDVQFNPVDIKSPAAWFRGISDLTIINGDEARILDYKSGNDRYADKGQLELMALATWRHFPEVKRIKSGLLFVVKNTFIREDFHIDQEKQLWEKWLTKYKAYARAHKTGVWNPKKSGLCKKHCPVATCAHYGG